MLRTDSQYAVAHALKHATAHGSAPAPDHVLSLCEFEHARESSVSGDGIDRAIPGWDHLWIDLGGEG